MTLIDLDTVKLKFPLWENYLTEFATESMTTSDLLEDIVDDAEAYMQSFSTFTAPISAGTRLHLMRIVRYFSYMKKHDSSPIKENELPTIIRDFRMTDAMLQGGMLGTGNVRVTTNERLWGPDSDE